MRHNNMIGPTGPDGPPHSGGSGQPDVMAQNQRISQQFQNAANQNERMVGLLQQVVASQSELLALEREKKMSQGQQGQPSYPGQSMAGAMGPPTQGQYHFQENLNGVQFSSPNVNFENFGYAPRQTVPDQTIFQDAVMMSNYGHMVSNQTREQIIDQQGARLTNAGLAGIGAGASFIGSNMAYSIGAGAGGLKGLALGGLAGAGTGVAVGSFFDNAVERAKIHQSYAKYLGRESYQFINPQESNNTRGYGGFSRSESQDMARFMHRESIEQHLDPEEMMGLLQGYTESGLLKDVSDMETFQKKVSSLTDNVRKGVVMLNETQESIMELMADMKKMGINEGEFGRTMSLGKILGAQTGQDASELIRDIISSVKEHISGTGLDGGFYTDKYQNLNLKTNAMFEHFQQNQGALDPKEKAAFHYMMNNGGPQGATRTIAMMQDSMMDEHNLKMLPFFDFDGDTGQFHFNQSKYEDIISQDLSLSQLHDLARSAANTMPDTAIREWKKNSSIYSKNYIDENQMRKISLMLSRGMTKEMGMDPDKYLTGLDLIMPGTNAEQRAFYEQYMQSDVDTESLMKQMQMMASMESFNAEMIANKPGIGASMKQGWRRFKNSMGEWATHASDWVTDKYQGLNDRIYGRRHTDLQFNTKYIDPEASDWGFSQLTGKTQSTLKNIGILSGQLDRKGYDVSPIRNALFERQELERGQFAYDRQVFRDASKLTGKSAQHFDDIRSMSSREGLSETIVEALVRFSDTSAGKKMFGADSTIIEEMAKENAMSAHDMGNLPLDKQLDIVTQKLGKLVDAYGGNEDLAMKAFFGGQGALDQELRKLGYAIDDWRRGDKSGFQGVVVENVKTGDGAGYNFTSGGGGSGGTSARYDVTGAAISGSQGLIARQDIGFTRGSKNFSDESVYDLTYYYAGEYGISPNALGTFIKQESSGNPNLIGSSGDIGLGQIMPQWKYVQHVGEEFVDSKGNRRVVGQGVTQADIDEQLRNENNMKYRNKNIINDLLDPEINMYLTGKYATQLLDEYEGNAMLAYGAYNMPAPVRTAFKELKEMGYSANQITPEVLRKHQAELRLRPSDLKARFGNGKDVVRNMELFWGKYQDGMILQTDIDVTPGVPDTPGGPGVGNVENETIVKDKAGNIVNRYKPSNAIGGADFIGSYNEMYDQSASSIRRRGRGFVSPSQKRTLLNALNIDTLPDGEKRTSAGFRHTGKMSEDGYLLNKGYDNDSFETILSTIDGITGATYTGKRGQTRQFERERNLRRWYEQTRREMLDYGGGKKTDAATAWRNKEVGERADSVMIMKSLGESYHGERLSLDVLKEEEIEAATTAQDRAFAEKIGKDNVYDPSYNPDKKYSKRLGRVLKEGFEKNFLGQEHAYERYEKISNWQASGRVRSSSTGKLDLDISKNTEDLRKDVKDQIEKLKKNKDEILNSTRTLTTSFEEAIKDPALAKMFNVDELEKAYVEMMDGNSKNIKKSMKKIEEKKKQLNREISLAEKAKEEEDDKVKKLNESAKRAAERGGAGDRGDGTYSYVEANTKAIDSKIASLKRDLEVLSKAGDTVKQLVDMWEPDDAGNVDKLVKYLKDLELEMSELEEAAETYARIGGIAADIVFGTRSEGTEKRKDFLGSMDYDVLTDEKKRAEMGFEELMNTVAGVPAKLGEALTQAFQDDFIDTATNVMTNAPDQIKEAMLQSLGSLEFNDQEVANAMDQWLQKISLGDLDFSDIEGLDSLPEDAAATIAQNFVATLLELSSEFGDGLDKDNKNKEQIDKFVDKNKQLYDSMGDMGDAAGNLAVRLDNQVSRINQLEEDVRPAKTGLFGVIGNWLSGGGGNSSSGGRGSSNPYNTSGYGPRGL